MRRFAHVLILACLASLGFGAVNPVLTFNLSDIGSQLARSGHVPSDYFTVISDGVVNIYPTANKSSAISQYAATSGFSGWRSLDGSDLSRIAYTTNDSYPSGAINAGAYSVDPTGVADSYAGITAAISAATAAGGGTVYLPPGNYKTSAAIVLPSKVQLVGAGAGGSISGATPDSSTAATRITATGSMTAVISCVGSGQYVNFGCLVQGIYLDANDLASEGILFKSVSHSAIRDVTIARSTADGILLTTLPPGTLSVGPQDTQNNLIENVIIVQTSTASASANGITFDSDPGFGSNASENTVQNAYVRHKNGVAYNFKSCDGNRCYSLRSRPESAGTGYGVYFHEDAAAGSHSARYNSVFGCELSATGGSGGGALFEGHTLDNQSTYSYENSIYGYAFDNGSPNPTFETFAKGIAIDSVGNTWTAQNTTGFVGPVTVTSQSTARQLTWLANTTGGVVTVNSFANGRNGQHIVIVGNNGGSNLVVNHNTGGGTQKIFTKSGAAITRTGGLGVVRLYCDGTNWYEE